MDANQTSEAVLNLIRKSNLNFKIEESPFTLTITIRKSFIKNKNGNIRSSGFENSSSTVLQENPAPFPWDQNFDNIHSNLKNPLSSNSTASLKEPAPCTPKKYCESLVHKTTNNREQQQSFMNPMEQSVIYPRNTYTKFSPSPFFQTYTHHQDRAQKQCKLPRTVQQPSQLSKTFPPHNFYLQGSSSEKVKHPSLPLLHAMNPNKFQHQDSLFNPVNQLSPLFQIFPKHNPSQQKGDNPTLMPDPFSNPTINMHTSTNPSFKEQTSLPSDSTSPYTRSSGRSSTSSSSSPFRCPSSRTRTTSTWDFPFKYHPAGLDDDSDPNLSDEELEPDELLKKLMIRYNIK